MSSRSRYSLRASASGLKRQRSLIQSTSSLAGLAWQCLSSGTLVVTRVALPVPETTSSGPALAPKGILYSCSGEFFITEALHSARSSLRHNPLPHVLFASGEVDATDGVSIVAATWADAVDHGFFIIFDLAIGGAFPAAFGGGPAAATVSGAALTVDYVRVFTKSR